MNVRVAAVAVLVLVAQSSGAVQDEIDQELVVKRYRQMIHALVSRSNAKAELGRIVADQGKRQSFTEDHVKKLQDGISAALDLAITEIATSWASSPERFREEASIGASGVQYFLESTKAWRTFLADSLTKEQLAAWDKDYQARSRTVETQVEAARQRTVQRAAMAQRAAEALADQERLVAIARANRMVVMAGAMARSSKGTLVAAARAAVTRAQGQAKQSLEKEVTWLIATFDLTEAQSRRLNLAIKGAIKKHFAGQLTRVDALEAEEFTEENDQEYLEELKQIFMTARTIDSARLTAGDFWTSAVRSTLGKGKFEEYEREQIARAAFAREAEIARIILTIDRVARLRIVQREQLKRALNDFDGPLTTLSTGFASSLYRALPDELAGEFDRVLSEQQADAVRNSRPPRTRIRGLER